MQPAEIVATMVACALEAVERQAREIILDVHGVTLTEEQWARVLRPLRDQLVVEYTDSVDAAGGL